MSATAFVVSVRGLSGNFISDLRIWRYAGILTLTTMFNLGEGSGDCACKCPFVKFPCGISYSQMGI